jgi:hypothetical protein
LAFGCGGTQQPVGAQQPAEVQQPDGTQQAVGTQQVVGTQQPDGTQYAALLPASEHVGCMILLLFIRVLRG